MANLDKRKSFMLDEKMVEDMGTYVKMLNVSEGEYIRQAIRRHLVHTALTMYLHRWSKVTRDEGKNYTSTSSLALWGMFQEFIPDATAELLTHKQFETYAIKEFGSIDLLTRYLSGS